MWILFFGKPLNMDSILSNIKVSYWFIPNKLFRDNGFQDPTFGTDRLFCFMQFRFSKNCNPSSAECCCNSRPCPLGGSIADWGYPLVSSQETTLSLTVLLSHAELKLVWNKCWTSDMTLHLWQLVMLVLHWKWLQVIYVCLTCQYQFLCSAQSHIYNAKWIFQGITFTVIGWL